MVLLDLIDLRLKEERGADGDADDYGSADEDEEEDDGWGADQGAGGTGSGAARRRLRRVALHECPEQPGAFWAVHDRGAWALALRWLPAVARQLAAATAAETEGFGAASAADCLGDEVESGPGLPKPALRELLVSESGLVASAPVGSVLAGSSVALLERNGDLSLARPGAALPPGGGATGDGSEGLEAEEERLEALIEAAGGGSGHALGAAAAQAAVQVSSWSDQRARGAKPAASLRTP
jgi:hypothetical protein